MTSQTLQQLVEKWQAKFAAARADLEAKAAAGDAKATYLLRELAGDPVKQRVDAPIPGPHWAEREPEQEGNTP